MNAEGSKHFQLFAHHTVHGSIRVRTHRTHDEADVTTLGKLFTHTFLCYREL